MSDISDKFFIEEIERLKAENFELKSTRTPFNVSFIGYEESVVGTKYIIEFMSTGIKVEKYEEDK